MSPVIGTGAPGATGKERRACRNRSVRLPCVHQRA